MSPGVTCFPARRSRLRGGVWKVEVDELIAAVSQQTWFQAENSRQKNWPRLQFGVGGQNIGQLHPWPPCCSTALGLRGQHRATAPALPKLTVAKAVAPLG